jgi:membrane-bound lytic murein transglycosylase D
MAIQPRLLVLALSFSSILTSGTFMPATADPFLSPSDIEHAAIPPGGDDFGRLDLSMEPLLAEGGSGPGPSRWEPVAITDDALAEAFAESVRLAAPPVRPLIAPYPMVLNSQVRFFLDRFTGDHRRVVGTWLDRSKRYLAMIREKLRAQGLPEELAFTAMIESGYNPLAVSRGGAKGMWQFMADTARRYGRRVDQWVDERLDPEKSTNAALSYLRDLHALFGSWQLAQAAYNAGEVKVMRAIKAARSNDFWVLARTNLLRRETKEFVPQIHAAAMIGREPERYGFDPTGTPAALVDRVSVPASTDLRRLSSVTGLSAEALRDLNPVLLRGVTPPGQPFDLKVPDGARSAVTAALTSPSRVVTTASTHVAHTKSETHVVRPRDTVSSIARRYGISVRDVVKWNGLEAQNRIKTGDRLRVADARGEGADRVVR